MNRFFRSALFPLVIIAALVWLALQTLGGHGTPSAQETTSGFIQDIKDGKVTQPVTIDPNKQSFSTTIEGKSVTVHYATSDGTARRANGIDRKR